jgi:hypothetical protein
MKKVAVLMVLLTIFCFSLLAYAKTSKTVGYKTITIINYLGSERNFSIDLPEKWNILLWERPTDEAVQEITLFACAENVNANSLQNGRLTIECEASLTVKIFKLNDEEKRISSKQILDNYIAYTIDANKKIGQNITLKYIKEAGETPIYYARLDYGNNDSFELVWFGVKDGMGKLFKGQCDFSVEKTMLPVVAKSISSIKSSKYRQ